MRQVILMPSFNLQKMKKAICFELDTEIDGLELYYTFDNTYPDHQSPLYIRGEKLTIPNDADTFRVISYRDGKPAGKMITVSLAELEKRVI